jgi:general secretion pathway protein B
MSYILDALRRSQAERERGQVPGLHAQPELGTARPVPAAESSTTPAAGTPWWVWLLLAGVVALAASLVGVLMGRAARAPASAPVVASPATAPAQKTTPAPATPSVTAAQPALPAPAVDTPAAPSLPVVVSAKPVPNVAPSAAPSAAPVAEPKRPAAAPTPLAVQPAPPPAPVPALTAEMKRDWPPLVVGGSVWSDTASARFVILNGQVVREGESTAAGVLVERINAKSAVLRWREQRAELPL